MQTNSKLFDNFSIGQLNLKNRVAVAPMTRVSTLGDGIPTALMQEYYARYATGDFGLIITEGVYTDRTYSQGYPNQPGMTNDEQQQGWQKIADAVHQADGKTLMQLMHAGATSQHLSNTRAPSAIQPMRHMLAGYSKKQGRYPVPQAMNLAEIDEVIEGFVSAAKRAEQANFDGVEIHGANGYLLDQFLTDYTNTREDKYGGSVEDRCQLNIEIIKEIKRNVSSHFVVGIRLSQAKVNDFHYTWPGGIEDGKIIFKAMQDAGADYIHFASEGKGFRYGCLTRSGESLPQLAREITGLPVIANGALDKVDEANIILDEGHGDLIALGTGALANPDWPRKVASDQNPLAFDPAMFAQGVTVQDQFEWEYSANKAAN